MEDSQLELDDGTLVLGSRPIGLIHTTMEVPRNTGKVFALLNKIFKKLWDLYIAANSKPLTAMLLLVLVIGINIALFFLAVLTHPVQIDYSLRAFEVTGHPASKKLDSLIAAREDTSRAAKEDREKHGRRSGRSANNPEVVINSQYKRQWKLDLVYLSKDDNIFTAEKLEYIHTIEKSLMQHPKFQDFCWKDKEALKDKVLVKNLKGCMPPNSLIDYFYRTKYFDGQDKDLANVQETLDYLLTKLTTFWYVDEKFDADYRKSRFLRSQLNFGTPLKGFSDDGHTYKQQHEVFRKFLVKFVEQLESKSSEQVTVLYGSSEIYDYEIKHTFYHDVLLAVISFGLIIFLLFILTSFSLWLTIFGVLTILFSLPFSYFVYRVLLRISTVGILTGTTAFVIIGIGVDDVFVFINVFRQATHLKDIRERMKHSIFTAGKVTFFTSFTTAAAFGANALTKVPAVHDFGLFTCILVMSCWLMVVLLMPPTLFLWNKWLIKCEMCLCLNKCCHKFCATSQMDTLVDNDELELNTNAREMREMNNEASSATEMAEFNREANEKSVHSECCTITNLLTRFMDNFIAKPVIRFRHSVIVIFFIITGASIVAITQLKTASGRPELFPSDTNLQKLLNLQFNFSSSYIDCSSCSGGLKPVHERVTAQGHFRSPVRRSVNDAGILSNSSMLLNGSHGFNHDRQDVGSHVTASTWLDATTPILAAGTSDTLTRVNEGLPLTTPIDNLQSTSIREIVNSEMENSTRGNLQTTRKTFTKKKSRHNITVSSNFKTMMKPTTATSISVTSTVDKKSSMKRKTEKTVHSEQGPTLPSKTQRVTTEGKRRVHSTSTSSIHNQTTPPLCPKPCTPVERPIVDKTAIVFLVFGIKGVDQSTVSGKHFFGTNRGTPIYDKKFTMVGDELQVVATGALVKALCKICSAFQNNTDLVLPGGADCFPRRVYRQLKLFKYEECQSLVEPRYANGRPSLSMVGVIHKEIKWIAMSFESTTYKGKSVFNVFEDYNRWENFTATLLNDPEMPEMLKGGFQTSETWVNMFSEMIAVNGAIYGITLSLVMCLAAVVIFTGNFKLSMIVFMTIGGALCVVVAVFWLLGWTLGAIEAISLSILVGTSVDYTVHITKGYIMANKMIDFQGMTNRELRSERTRMALNHIGVSIFSSAVTTLIAAIPLCLTKIRLFSKFGQILAINTTMSILYTLTICVSLLSIMGPTRFRGSIKSHLFALMAVSIVIGVVVLALYLLSVYAGVKVPGPSGGDLFH